jgi:hypothetical protein
LNNGKIEPLGALTGNRLMVMGRATLGKLTRLTDGVDKVGDE